MNGLCSSSDSSAPVLVTAQEMRDSAREADSAIAHRSEATQAPAPQDRLSVLAVRTRDGRADSSPRARRRARSARSRRGLRRWRFVFEPDAGCWVGLDLEQHPAVSSVGSAEAPPFAECRVEQVSGPVMNYLALQNLYLRCLPRGAALLLSPLVLLNNLVGICVGAWGGRPATLASSTTSSPESNEFLRLP